MSEEITLLSKEIKKVIAEQEILKKSFEKVQGAEKKLKDIHQQKKEVENKKEHLEKQIHHNQSKIEFFEHHLHELETEKKKIQDLGPQSSCPTCKRPLEDHYGSLISDFSKKMTHDLTKLSHLREILQKDLFTQDTYITSLNQFTEKEKQVRTLVMDEVKIQQDLKHLQNQHMEKKEKLDTLKKSYASMNDISFDASRYTQACVREEKLRVLKDTYLVLQGDVERLSSIKKDIFQFQQDILVLLQQVKLFLQLNFGGARLEHIF